MTPPAVVETSPTQVVFPEIYGFYLRSGNEFVRFDTDKDLRSQYNRPAATSILVFDRRLQMPQLKLDEAFKLWRAVPVRFDVTLVHEETDGPVVDYVLEEMNRFTTIEPALAFSIKPIEGKLDMVELIPDLGASGNALAPSVYGFRFLDENLFLFGVGLEIETESDVGAAALIQRQEASPHDQFAKVVLKQSGGYWGQFKSNMDYYTLSAGSFRQGKRVEREWLAPLKELESLQATWKEEFRKACASQFYRKAQSIVDRLSTYRQSKDSAQEELDRALIDYARTHLGSQPIITAALAHRVTSHSKLHDEARTLFDAAQKANLLEMKRLATEKEQWNAQVFSMGKPIASFDYIGERSFFGDSDRVGKIFLHTTGFKFAKNKERPEDHGFWNMGGVGDVQPFTDKQPSTFGNQEKTIFGLRVAHVGYLEPLNFEFSKQPHRDAFLEALNRAKAAFVAEYKPEKNWTLGFVQPSFDTVSGQICYTVVLDDTWLSPPIQVHPLWSGWQIDTSGTSSNYAMWIDGKRQDGSRNAQKQLSTGQKIQFAMSHAHHGGEFPKIKVRVDLK